MTHLWIHGMKLLKKLTLILSSLFLVSCATTPPPVLLPTEKKVEVSKDVMRDCGKFIEAMEKGKSFEDVLIVFAEDSKIFAECKQLNDSKKTVILRFLFNQTSKEIAEQKAREAGVATSSDPFTTVKEFWNGLFK